MAAQADLGVNGGLEVVGIGGRAKDRNRHVLEAGLHLVVQVSFEGGPHVTVHAGHVLVCRHDPAVVGRLDVMAAGAEPRMTGQRDGDSPKGQRGGNDRHDDDGLGLPDHATGSLGK